METENCEGRISLSTTWPSLPEAGNSQGKSVAEEWLLRFAVNCGQPLDDGRVALWCDEFAGIEPSLLDRAFRELMRAHTFNCIPTVGEVWQQLGKARRIESLAEQQVAHERWLSGQPPWEELHRRGREYCERMCAWAREIAGLQKTAALKVKSEPLVIARPERLAEQKARLEEWLREHPEAAVKSKA